MAIPALLIGAGVVGVMWAASSKPDGKPRDAAVNPQTAHGGTGTPGTTGSTGDLSQIAASVAAAGGQPVDATQQPAATGNPAQTTTVTSGDAGATVVNTDTTAGGVTGASSTPATQPAVSAGGAAGTVATAPGPTLHVVNLDAAYTSQYGSASTKADQSAYYSQQASAGQVIY